MLPRRSCRKSLLLIIAKRLEGNCVNEKNDGGEAPYFLSFQMTGKFESRLSLIESIRNVLLSGSTFFILHDGTLFKVNHYRYKTRRDPAV